MWPWSADTQGHVYLFHFSSPIGNLANPRAQASHYIGFAEDIESRLEKQYAGKGAKIVRAALEKGVLFEVYTWPAPLASEKLIKRAKNTARYCPACASQAGRVPRPIPQPPNVTQLALALDEPMPEIVIGRMSWLEMTIEQGWRAQRIPAPAGLDDDLL